MLVVDGAITYGPAGSTSLRNGRRNVACSLTSRRRTLRSTTRVRRPSSLPTCST